MDTSLGKLFCRLYDRRTGVPLSSAHLMCSGQIAAAIIADADEDGAFQIAVPEGVCDLVFYANGYTTIGMRGVGIMAGCTTMLVRPLVFGTNAPMIAEPASAIVGHVTGPDGLPAQGLTVQATSVESAYMTQTDITGAYFFHSVVPGTYTVTLREADGTTIHEEAIVPRPFLLSRIDFHALQRRATLESLLRIELPDRSVSSNSLSVDGHYAS